MAEELIGSTGCATALLLICTMPLAFTAGVCQGLCEISSVQWGLIEPVFRLYLAMHWQG